MPPRCALQADTQANAQPALQPVVLAHAPLPAQQAPAQQAPAQQAPAQQAPAQQAPAQVVVGAAIGLADDAMVPQAAARAPAQQAPAGAAAVVVKLLDTTLRDWLAQASVMMDQAIAKVQREERCVEMSQFMLFLSCTRQIWTSYGNFADTLRKRLQHFHNIEQWPMACMFESMLFPGEPSQLQPRSLDCPINN